VTDLVIHLHDTKDIDSGAILVFLTSWAEQDQVRKELTVSTNRVTG
jgi:hypothetical protein